MPPEKFDITIDAIPVGPPPTKMPSPAEIDPELLMPPEKVDIITDAGAPPTKMPWLAVEAIVPALLMPPVNVAPVTRMAVGPAAILLAVSSEMPPLRVPGSLIWPLIVLLLRTMPVGLIVPLLVMPLVSVELLTAMPVIAVALVQPGAVVLL